MTDLADRRLVSVMPDDLQGTDSAGCPVTLKAIVRIGVQRAAAPWKSEKGRAVVHVVTVSRASNREKRVASSSVAKALAAFSAKPRSLSSSAMPAMK